MLIRSMSLSTVVCSDGPLAPNSMARGLSSDCSMSGGSSFVHLGTVEGSLLDFVGKMM